MAKLIVTANFPSTTILTETPLADMDSKPSRHGSGSETLRGYI